MFGWEFPPMNKGGLGTACYGLTKALTDKGANITFVVPKLSEKINSHVNLIPSNFITARIEKIKIETINSPIHAYMTPQGYDEEIIKFSKENKFSKQSKFSKKEDQIYGNDLFYEVKRYAIVASSIAEDYEHDVIHAHDWLTYEAGINAKKKSGKPLIVHVHATEFDRTGGNGVNQGVYDIERKGMHEADKVIAVSNFTKNMIIEKYGVPSEKIEVIHNGANALPIAPYQAKLGKTVLFLGRITLQKGPDYFVQAAKRVLEIEPDTTFVVAGSGDMEYQMIEQAAELGIGNKMLFMGFLKGDEVSRAYQMADLYVMPSVSEPFGLTPLEAIRNNVPVIISKQSGVSEVLNNALKVDFWDTEKLASYMVSVLRHSPLKEELRDNGKREVEQLNWDKSAQKCLDLYNKIRGESW